MADQATAEVPYGRRTQHQPDVDEVHILWMTPFLGCDGDSISMTGASEPSIEDLVLGAIPGLPKVHVHNPVLAYEVGDELAGGRSASETRCGSGRKTGPTSGTRCSTA